MVLGIPILKHFRVYFQGNQLYHFNFCLSIQCGSALTEQNCSSKSIVSSFLSEQASLQKGCIVQENTQEVIKVFSHWNKTSLECGVSHIYTSTQHTFLLRNKKRYLRFTFKTPNYLGPVVQSIISLTSSLRGQLIKRSTR